jgi:peptidyl-dipeptidase A
LAQWELNTHIVEGDTLTEKKAAEADEAYAKFTGSKEVITKVKEYLTFKDDLSGLQIRQLNYILYMAGGNPEIAGDIVKKRIEAQNKQTKTLFGYTFTLNGKEITPNDIDKGLREETNLDKRLKIWNASKEVGKVLKPGLVELQQLRNQTVQALDYKDYFEYQVSDYGMTSKEMVDQCRQLVAEIWPLYRELHTWARYELATKYKQPVPDLIPAHWLPNRWGQDWTAMVEVEGLNIDDSLSKKSPEWIVQQAEDFYVSLSRNCLLLSMRNQAYINYQLIRDLKRIPMHQPGTWIMIKTFVH